LDQDGTLLRGKRSCVGLLGHGVLPQFKWDAVSTTVFLEPAEPFGAVLTAQFEEANRTTVSYEGPIGNLGKAWLKGAKLSAQDVFANPLTCRVRIGFVKPYKDFSDCQIVFELCCVLRKAGGPA